MKRNKTARWVRGGLLAILLVWVTYESIMHQILGGGKSPSIHALCPYGALESLYALLISGSFIQKIYSGTLILLGVTVLIAILFRRSFCGLLCPFGALQEFFARIGHKIWKNRPVIPVKVDYYLRYLKYLTLVLTVVMAWRLGRLWMTSYDPYAAYGHITAIPATLAEDPLSIVGFTLLGVTLIGSFVYDRFFCKYLCPAGAFYAIIGKASPTKIVRNDDACIHCNLCSKVCPVNLDVAKLDKVTSAECLNCNECVAVCPKKGAIEIKTFKKTLPPLVMVILVAAMFFVPIGIAQVTGYYQVVNEAPSAGEIISFTELKGFMTIAESAEALGLSDAAFRAALKIPADLPADTRMSELSTLVEGYDFDAAKEEAAAALETGATAATTAEAAVQTIQAAASVSVNTRSKAP
jgi:polyferredoxin